MKYYIDTEFIEGFHKPLFGKKRHFIDLISIGIVNEKGQTYYAISKDFDLNKVWNQGDEWVKNNVLKSIHADLCKQVGIYGKTYHWNLFEAFTFDCMKTLLKWYGKSSKQIASEIKEFIGYKPEWTEYGSDEFTDDNDIQFFGYYADYDWVLFCSLFGRMIDLPKGFPMYCRDLKQMLDEKALTKPVLSKRFASNPDHVTTAEEIGLEKMLSLIKTLPGYPQQENEHNALADAKWNKKLHHFIKTL